MNIADTQLLSREIEYAQVTKMLGNGRLEALCFDGEKRLAHIRGKLRKKVCAHPLFANMTILMYISPGLDQPRRYYPPIAS